METSWTICAIPSRTRPKGLCILTSMIIEAKAPTRIDLAGGTLDLWPLYLFHPGAQTVNVAIDLFATCTVEELSTPDIILESDDIGAAESFPDLSSVHHDTELQLLSRMVEFFHPYTGLRVKTKCAAPPGSGLGGSSALAVAVAGAMNYLTGERYTDGQLLRIAQNIEAQVINVPTGCQDYYPAMFGGACSLHLDVQGIVRETLSVDLGVLQDHVVLCYTGKPHFSGTNNWEIFKAHIDGDGDIQARFAELTRTTGRMRSAVLAGDISQIAVYLAEEWENRKRLSKHVSTPKIERLIEAAADNGGLAAKVCGAGGGGCVVFLAAPGRKADVAAALTAADGEVLPVSITDRGLRIERIG